MVFDLGLSATALALLGIVFGAIIGSFLNVVIIRLPIMLKAEWTHEAKLFLGIEFNEEKSINIVSPRSQCTDCGTPIKALHNIPLLSYCFLRGRCGHCGSLISIQYPIIELLTAFVTAYFFTVYGISEKTLLSLLFSYCLIVLATIDMREQILPDQITLPLIWIGLGVSLFFGYWATPEESILGAFIFP
ncbi:prepilin peptidase [Porticoccaceae bacterium]|nr:prepilin peptidase [Porticoccaceae bacterium]